MLSLAAVAEEKTRTCFLPAPLTRSPPPPAPSPPRAHRTQIPQAFLVATASSRPESLEWSGGSSPSPAPGTEASPLRRALLKLGGFYSTESRLIRGSRRSYDAVVAQATDGIFVDGE